MVDPGIKVQTPKGLAFVEEVAAGIVYVTMCSNGVEMDFSENEITEWKEPVPDPIQSDPTGISARDRILAGALMFALIDPTEQEMLRRLARDNLLARTRAVVGE